jgi:exodeoxyribonuclease V gamma subunit
MAGLHLFRSNRIEVLSTLLAADVTDKLPGDPFAPIRIMVGSRGMERWLRHELAEKLSVCANFEFPFPAAAIDAIVGAALGEDRDLDLPDPWSPDALTWALLDVLPQSVSKRGFEIVRGFADDPAAWNGPVDAKEYGLARQIADVFERYVQHRPNLARAWSAGRAFPLPSGAESLAWQASLWHALAGRLGRSEHRATRIERAKKRLRAEASPPAMATPLFIFGVSSLPPSWMSMLGALSKHTDVDLFLLCPSDRYWADIRKRSGADTAHPLLLSMGKVARDFQQVLETQPDHYVQDGLDAFPDPADRDRCALAWLKSDLLAARHPAEAPDRPERAATSDDDSVQFHDCYGPTRQVEVLRDLILGMLEDHHDLEPRDILVMTPDIAKYASLVTAVFSQGPDRRETRDGKSIPGADGWGPAGAPAVPFEIADLSVRRLNPVADALLRVLEMVDGRLEASLVIDLLMLEPVRVRFGIAAGDIPTLRGWIERSGICWARDADHRARERQPADPQNTWRFGLRRLLLGVVMADDGGRLVAGDDAPGRETFVRPFDDIEGSDAPLLGLLVDFCNTLFSVIDALVGARPIGQWVSAIGDVLDLMTATTPSTSWQTFRVREALQTMAQPAAAMQSTRAIGLRAMRIALEERFDVASRATREQSGAVTFCAMRPMRSVPYQVVCLLGMDDDAFPRKSAGLAFDLVCLEPELGDTDPRDEDRYLLLEAIMAARRKLVVLYSGRDPRTNRRTPPCVPIAELRDLVDQTFPVTGGENSASVRITRQHPLLAVSPLCFSPKPSSFDRRLLCAARARREKLPLPAFFATEAHEVAAASPMEVTIDELSHFFKHPVEHLVHRRLRIVLGDDDAATPDREPIELGGLDRWKLRDALLHDLADGRASDQVLRGMRAAGALPLGYSGKALVDVNGRLARMILERLGLPRAPTDPIKVDLTLGGTRITGSIAPVYGSLIINGQFGELSSKRLIAPWLSLLAWHAQHRTDARAVIALGDVRQDGPVVSLAGLDAPANAREILTELISIYRRGTRHPIPLLPKASWAFARAFNKALPDPRAFLSGLPASGDLLETIGKARKAAENAWHGEWGDSADPYLSRVYEAGNPIVDDTGAAGALSLDFARLAWSVWGPVLRSLRQGADVEPWIQRSPR